MVCYGMSGVVSSLRWGNFEDSQAEKYISVRICFLGTPNTTVFIDNKVL